MLFYVAVNNPTINIYICIHIYIYIERYKDKDLEGVAFYPGVIL